MALLLQAGQPVLTNRNKTLPKEQGPRGLSDSYTNLDQDSSSESRSSVNYMITTGTITMITTTITMWSRTPPMVQPKTRLLPANSANLPPGTWKAKRAATWKIRRTNRRKMENHRIKEKEMRSTKMGKMENEKNIEIIWLKITHLENDIANEEWTEDPANLFLQKMWLRSNNLRPVTTCIKVQKQRMTSYKWIHRMQNALNDKSTWAPDQERPCLASPSSSPSRNS